MKSLRGLALTSLLCLAPLAHAGDRQVPLDSRIELRLIVNQLTMLALPEGISSATLTLPPERLEVGEDGQYMTLHLHDATVPPGWIGVVGQSGQLYKVHYKTVTTNGDEVVHLIRKAPTKPVVLTDATITRYLRTRKPLPGAEASTLPLPNPDDTRIALQDASTVRIGKRHALRAQLTNTQDVPLLVDERIGAARLPDAQTVVLSTWVWPPKHTITGVAVEEHLLPPHGSTTLYVIYEER